MRRSPTLSRYYQRRDTEDLARKAYEPKKKPRKKSARGAAYSAAFKKVQGRYKKKSGGWKKDGFKRAAAAARKMIK